MNPDFSFAITFVSLIYGLGITHSLTCIAENIQHKSEIKQSLLWWVWAILFLLFSCGTWFGIYFSWSHRSEWTMPEFSFLAIQSSVFYISLHLFFNHPRQIPSRSLETDFLNNKKSSFLCLGVVLFMQSILSNILFTAERWDEVIVNNLPQNFFIAVVIFLSIARRKTYHLFGALLCYIGFVMRMIY
jgi:hypothetical protein